MAKISVIIPAYNAETTLRTAVESILSQQVPELEIIIVNDGSTDGTDRLCHALASEYPCIHVITQKNAGICAARSLYGTPSTAARRCWGCASMSGAATGWRTLSLTPQPTGASVRRSTSRRSSTAILRVRRAPPVRTRRRHFWAASGRWSHGWRLNSTPPSAGAARRSCRPSGRTAAHRPSLF